MGSITTAASGDWSDTDTWTGGVLPAETDDVTIQNGHTVTIDDSAAATITVGNDTSTGLTIAAGGKLEYKSTATVDHILVIKGDFNISGTLEIGTTGNPIPSTRTFTIKLNYSASQSSVEFGMKVNDGATCTLQGASKNVSTFLAADAAANATSLTSSTSTGWKDGDQIVVASTSRTSTESEVGTMNGDASGTTLTVDGFGGAGGGLAYAHSGTAPTRAEIINLTRNIKITAYNTSYPSYLLINTTATVDIDYCEFSYLGSSTASKRGIDILTTSGSCAINYSSAHDFINGTLSCLLFGITGASSNNITLTYNVAWNIYYNFLVVSATSGTSITISNNIFIKNTNTAGYGCIVGDAAITFTYNTVVSCAYIAIYVSETSTDISGTYTNLTVHSCNTNGQSGLSIYGRNITGTVSDITAWRNVTTSQNGIYLALNSGTVSNLTAFGNDYRNIALNGYYLTVDTISAYSEASYTTAYGLYVFNCILYINNATIGNAVNEHTTADIDTGTNNNQFVRAYFQNSSCLSSTEVTGNNVTNWGQPHQIKKICSQKHDGSAGTNITWVSTGTLKTDTTLYKTASPSLRMTPNDASNKHISADMYIPVNSGDAVTITAWLRKSEAGDGAAYNGNQPKLLIRANTEIGSTAKTDTMAEAVGTWEQLSVTSDAVSADGVLQVYTDCDGTAGWVNVDDFVISYA